MLIKTLRTSFLQVTTMLSLAALLTACGGGSGSQLENTIKGSSSSSSTSSSSSVDTTQIGDLGYGSGENFEAGVIGVASGNAMLSAGGATTLTVNIVSNSGDLVTQSVTVTFNSRCFASDTAELKLLDGTLTNSVTTTNGEASLVYRAMGCVGEDRITATSTFEGETLSAQVTITVEADTVGSIQYTPLPEDDPAAPKQISLKGTGGQETSKVRFRVMGVTDAPMENVDVNFSLNTTVGGLSLGNSTGKTDRAGYVSTTVKAGTISTSVTVTATVPASNISTQSNRLVVSTGIPDQKSMSIAVDNFSPAAWQYNGTKVRVTVALADAFNNPAPKNTAVYFTTEGGAIVPGCRTEENEADLPGMCSVDWQSQEPRPTRDDNVFTVDSKLCTGLADLPGNRALSLCKARRAGRITILATALGNESFIDSNNNGIYDNTDQFADITEGGDCSRNVPVASASVPSGSAIMPCDDLPEAYLDKNENGIRESNEYSADLFQSAKYGGPGVYNGSDGKYNGALCPLPPEVKDLNQSDWEEAWPDDWPCTRQNVSIRQEAVIVMSCDTPLLNSQGGLPNQPTNITVNPGVTANNNIVPPIAAIPPETKTFNVILADCNGNGLPPGTTVSLNTTALRNASANHSLQGELPSSVDGTSFNVSVSASGTEKPNGVFYINITVPVPSGEVITTTAGIAVNL
jgi:hypothetical protein